MQKPKRKSISDELFRWTLILFATLLLCQVILQRMFIDFFYIESKAKNIDTELIALQQVLTNKRATEDKKTQAINRFQEQNNAVIKIINLDITLQQTIQQNTPSITLKTQDNSTYIIYLQANVKTQHLIQQTEIGQEIVCETMVYTDTNSLFPENISTTETIYNNLWSEAHDAMSLQNIADRVRKKDHVGEIKTLTGNIIDIYDGETDALKISGSYRDIMLNEQIQRFVLEYDRYKQRLARQMVYFLTSDKEYQMDSIFFAKQLNGQQIIFAMVPTQSVTEAASILKNLYGYLFVIAVFLTAIASYIHSRRVTKPLLNMTAVAKKIAKLNFSEKCVVENNDELGDLADSINSMSASLQQYTGQLETTNRDLERDIVAERKQDELRRELVANVSHEFKTPLTVIKGTVEGIKDGVYEADEDTLQSIMDEANRLNHMVFGLLELSRIEAQDYKLDIAPFDLWESTLRVNNTMKVVANQKNITVHLHGNECPVMGDSEKIEQVITNLYSNAIRYSPSGETIIINVSQSSKGVHFSMVNTGITIPKKELGNVWNGFYRIEKSRNRNSGGTGLGLLIVKRILEKHHSQYGVKNLTNGVEFYFFLDKYKMREKTKLDQADEAFQNIASSVKQMTENFLKKEK